MGAAKWRWTSTRYACPRRKRRESRKNSDLAVCDKISVTPTLVLKRYFADRLFFGSCITVFEPCGVTWHYINAEEKSLLVCAEVLNSRPCIYSQSIALSRSPIKSIVYSSVLKYGISFLVRAPIFNTTYLKISL